MTKGKPTMKRFDPATATRRDYGTMSLAELFDFRDDVQNGYSCLYNSRIPHTKKTVEAMQRGEPAGCPGGLTQGGKSCGCRDLNLATYGGMLRDIDRAIERHLNPAPTDLAEARRERLYGEAMALEERARGLRVEAARLDAEAEAIRAQAVDEVDREIDAIEAAHGWHCWIDSTDRGTRVTAGGRTAIVTGGAGCCLRRVYARIRADGPAPAPRDGDVIPCCANGGGSEREGLVFVGGVWRNHRRHADWEARAREVRGYL